MLASPAELTRAFDGLAITQQPTFAQLVCGGKLRYAASAAGGCDLVDDYSSRLICECIARRSSLLMIWPDSAERRAPLALAAGIVCDSVERMGGESGRGRILYVGADAAIRDQFASVYVGKTAIGGVFVQEFGRGDSRLQRVGPESSLPVVTTIVAPAQPDRVIRELRPRWIAIDCGQRNPPSWLPGVLAAARSAGVPVIGWTTLHLSPVANLWRAHGACVYRWPKVVGPVERIGSLDNLARRDGTAQLTPMVLDGQGVVGLSEQMVDCYLRLVRHTGRVQGQLVRDALSIAWRYLRLLESLPVPPDLYDAECVNYWGIPSLSRLKATLERFIQSLAGDALLRAELGVAYERLSAADRSLRDGGESPLWLATANLAVEATNPSIFVFQGRAHRDLFRFAMLSKFNISEQDLGELGVSLTALSDFSRSNDTRDHQVTLIGLPSRTIEWRMEALLEHREIRAVVWPHLEDALRRRAVEWSAGLGGRCDGPSPLRLSGGTSGRIERVRVGPARVVRLSEMRLGTGQQPTDSGLALWKRPDAAEAIRALFASQDIEEDAGDESGAFSQPVDRAETGGRSAEDEWVEEALRIVFDDGGQILLPFDDYVNVIGRTSEGVKVEPRYSRSLRVGDEILLVHGEHRRGVYDLLVSRVHSHATIAPWLQLVDRWHQDLRRAFIDAKRRSGTTFESVLTALRKQGSAITTSVSVRGWVLGFTLAPSDSQDIRRLGEVLDIPVAKQYPREIGNAASRLAGLHRSLSNRLNRWLESEDAGAAVLSGAQAVVDADLGLTFDDFKHSLVRGGVASVSQVHGPFLRSHIGHLRKAAS